MPPLLECPPSTDVIADAMPLETTNSPSTTDSAPVSDLPIERILARFDRCPAWMLAAGLACYFVGVAALDHLSGDHIPLAMLYLPAIALVCWRVNLQLAQLLSVLCATLWLLDDLVAGNHVWPVSARMWLTGTNLLFFLVVVSVLWRLRLALDRQRVLASTDALTGLLNLRSFMQRAELELARARRDATPLTAVFIDCDNFKQVNDTRGHRIGDQLLTTVSQTIVASVRDVDSVARIGGDEFAVLLPRVDRANAKSIVTRLQSALREQMRRGEWPVTFSMGVATFEELPEDAEALVNAADTAMYVVKHGTKDGIHFDRTAL